MNHWRRELWEFPAARTYNTSRSLRNVARP